MLFPGKASTQGLVLSRRRQERGPQLVWVMDESICLLPELSLLPSLPSISSLPFLPFFHYEALTVLRGACSSPSPFSCLLGNSHAPSVNPSPRSVRMDFLSRAMSEPWKCRSVTATKGLPLSPNQGNAKEGRHL